MTLCFACFIELLLIYYKGIMKDNDEEIYS